MINFTYLGDNVWTYENWKVIGHPEDGFELYLFVWPVDDANEAMRHIGSFKSLCDIDQFLHFKAKVA